MSPGGPYSDNEPPGSKRREYRIAPRDEGYEENQELLADERRERRARKGREDEEAPTQHRLSIDFEDEASMTDFFDRVLVPRFRVEGREGVIRIIKARQDRATDDPLGGAEI